MDFKEDTIKDIMNIRFINDPDEDSKSFDRIDTFILRSDVDFEDKKIAYTYMIHKSVGMDERITNKSLLEYMSHMWRARIEDGQREKQNRLQKEVIDCLPCNEKANEIVTTYVDQYRSEAMYEDLAAFAYLVMQQFREKQKNNAFADEFGDQYLQEMCDYLNDSCESDDSSTIE